MLDYLGRIGEAITDLGGLDEGGTSSKPLETVVDGFERLPTAINMLFDGANTGKLIVRIAD